MSRRGLTLGALGGLAVIIGYLVWDNLADNVVYYLTPSEAIEQRAEYASGERFRLGGLVEQGGIEETGDGVEFLVGDGGASVPVVHSGTPPQLFRAGIGVVVEGAWDDDRFLSDTMLIHHDEQYRAPDGQGVYKVPSGEA